MGELFNKKEYTDLRKKLRTNATDAEWRLWNEIKEGKLGHKFRRQQGIGKYIVDFCCPKQKLII